MWYLADREWPGPNLLLLNNALEQTGWTGSTVDEKSWALGGPGAARRAGLEPGGHGRVGRSWRPRRRPSF